MDDLVNTLQARADAKPPSAMVVEFALLDGDAVTLDAREGPARVRAGPAKAPTTRMLLTREDFAAMLDGSLDPMQAFMGGRLKISGDMAPAVELAALFKPN